MITLNRRDIYFLRQVLREKEMYRRAELGPYFTSVRNLTLAAVTMLQGAEVKQRDLEGLATYGLLLWHLVVVPGLPPNGTPTPVWLSKISKAKLVERSLTYGFHASVDRSGTGLYFIPHPTIAELLKEDKLFPERCRTWYDEALRSIRS